MKDVPSLLQPSRRRATVPFETDVTVNVSSPSSPMGLAQGTVNRIIRRSRASCMRKEVPTFGSAGTIEHTSTSFIQSMSIWVSAGSTHPPEPA